MIVTPKVGQRGRWPSFRSNESSGKLDTIPPSTSVDSSPVLGLVRMTGRNSNGTDIVARTASATDCSAGSRP